MPLFFWRAKNSVVRKNFRHVPIYWSNQALPPATRLNKPPSSRSSAAPSVVFSGAAMAAHGGQGGERTGCHRCCVFKNSTQAAFEITSAAN